LQSSVTTIKTKNENNCLFFGNSSGATKAEHARENTDQEEDFRSPSQENRCQKFIQRFRRGKKKVVVNYNEL
jgi:hypothetical protein